MTHRTIKQTIVARPTSDGAGVRLKRSIGTDMLSELDPFLLLDNFGTENPDDYIAGFPDHPHRGFETVTYMIRGLMRHKDSSGAEGLLRPGGVQWMTAGHGIIHSEMPEQTEGEMSGFQLWVNLPATEKMCVPRYQDFEPDEVPLVQPAGGVEVRVIAGEVDGVPGPVNGIAIEPTYLDITFPPGATFSTDLPLGHTAFAYVFQGQATISNDKVELDHLAVLSDGDQVRMSSADGGRLILVAGKPFGEPVARYGPFVMNTTDEIRQAIYDYQQDNFI
jgi:quercetin 2,3-dioxygenase